MAALNNGQPIGLLLALTYSGIDSDTPPDETPIEPSPDSGVSDIYRLYQAAIKSSFRK